MITFFTDPYEDELLYGTISRYHYYIGNIDYKDTLQELFGKSSIIPSLYLHSNLQYLCDQLGSKYTPEHLIYNHTIFPYYAPFLPEQRKKEIISDMKGDGGKSIYMKIGMTAGSICVKDGIYYCHFCSLKDLEDHGEVYIHRVHQIQGVLVCPIHKVKLRRFIVNKTNSSRLEFIRLDERCMDFNREEEKNDRINEELIRIAQSAKFLLSNNIETFNKEKVYSNYKKLLDKKEFLSVGKSVKQNELADE